MRLCNFESFVLFIYEFCEYFTQLPKLILNSKTNTNLSIMYFLYIFTGRLWHRNHLEMRFSLNDRLAQAPTKRLYNPDFFLRAKRPLYGLNHPPSSRTETKVRVQPHSGSSCFLIERNLII
jgi:hypothetical protein